MNFTQLKHTGAEGEFILDAYVGPVIERWGIEIRPVITKDEFGWSTHMAEGFWSTEELTEQIKVDEIRLIYLTFFHPNSDHDSNIFETLIQAQSSLNGWESEKLMANFDAICYQLGKELSREYFSLEWNQEGRMVRGLYGPLSDIYNDGHEVFESRFSDDVHNRLIELLPKIDFNHLDKEFLDRFDSSSIKSIDDSLSNGVMEFGNIRVGTKQASPGCGCVLPIVILIGSCLIVIMGLVIL